MIVGSRAFFEGLEGFTPKDIDILELVDNPTGFKDVRQFKFRDKCVFQWRRMPIEEFIEKKKKGVGIPTPNNRK